MAWLLRKRGDSVRYVPKIIPTPDCVDHHTLMDYLRSNGFLPDGMCRAGKAIDERFWPKTGRFATPVDLVPRMLGLCGFPLVPESWRGAIEAFEPRVHQFKHIPLRYSDGTPLEERFYAMNIMHVLRDVVDRERSTAARKINFAGREIFVKASNHPKEIIVFKRDSLNSSHLWVSAQVLTYNINMSNDLYRKISQIDDLSSILSLRIEEV